MRINLIIAKIKTLYPGHALFAGEDAPKLTGYDVVTRYIFNRLDLDEVMLSRGVVDVNRDLYFKEDTLCINVSFKRKYIL